IHSHSAGLVVSREAAALVEAISRLLQDTALRGQLVARAAQLVDTSYRIEAVADAIIQAYTWLIENLLNSFYEYIISRIYLSKSKASSFPCVYLSPFNQIIAPAKQ